MSLFFCICRQSGQSITVTCNLKAGVQYVVVEKVTKMLCNAKCKALLGVHAFSGCDTVRAFAGREKLSSLRLIDTDHKEIHNLVLKPKSDC